MARVFIVRLIGIVGPALCAQPIRRANDILAVSLLLRGDRYALLRSRLAAIIINVAAPLQAFCIHRALCHGAALAGRHALARKVADAVLTRAFVRAQGARGAIVAVRMLDHSAVGA
jgi:hypothetical protein